MKIDLETLLRARTRNPDGYARLCQWVGARSELVGDVAEAMRVHRRDEPKEAKK